ncbi:LysR family transcriptional regulator [Pseudoruegeria sp. SK021]|uniref:LysR family transcriptional regulator n=1 Tax=Pseudoruegeria sp. SK021 TaxID=1933035 RepID=UPI000A24693C|nr:LysR substrate-binding domain-containing protein [Pseudoruegeria sp. SK021]OSP54884.1 hypothetical protein BV911_10470 [Pseudoruegeria sp. SK021]
MEVEPRHIRHLAAIGAHGTFVSAAKALGISQPTLSLSIQRLEDILKTTLVDRGRNGAVLTEPGRILAQRSDEVDKTIAAVLNEIELLSQGIKGTLRVGGTPLSTHGIIPATVAHILGQTKDVTIEIVEAIDEDLLDLLAGGQLDIVISAAALAAPSDAFDFTPLFEAKTVLAMRKGNPLANHSSLSLARLQDEMWAMPPAGGTFRKQVEALYTTNGLEFPKRIIQTASIASLLRIVRMSDAISVLSKQLIQDELHYGTLECVEISHALAPRVFGILTRQDRVQSNLAKLFCEVAIQQAKSL